MTEQHQAIDRKPDDVHVTDVIPCESAEAFRRDQMRLSEVFGITVIVDMRNFSVNTPDGVKQGLGVIFSSARNKHVYPTVISSLRLPPFEPEKLKQVWRILMDGMIELRQMMPADSDGIMLVTAARSILDHVKDRLMAICPEGHERDFNYIPPNEKVTELKHLQLMAMLSSLGGIDVIPPTTSSEIQKYTPNDTRTILAAEEKRKRKAAKLNQSRKVQP